MDLEFSIRKKNSLSNILNKSWMTAVQIIMGSVFLALMARLSIPLVFTPVPISMQSLALFLLAIFLGSRKAPLAVATYLVQATFGFPVLAGGLSNPLWMMGPKAGYLIGFVLATYLAASLIERQKNSTIFKNWIIFCVSEITLLTFGTLWLSYFVGLENALLLGVVPFLPGAFIKISIAACVLKSFQFAKLKTQN